jgi:23S rRNA (pseudouridine1915-N3)-methyltransferase
MRLRIVALGQRMPAWVRTGYDEYAKRMPREYALELIELKAAPRDRGKSVAQMLDAEATSIRSACPNDHIVALDERGSAWTTRDLAAKLVRWRDDDTNVAFVIGSADGLDEAFKRSANERLAVSSMTLPHGLVRIVMAEQLYRAGSLIAGHPYHRE